MSTHVVTQLHARPGRGDDVGSLLLEILGESLEHDGCEAIRITRDQENPDHVVAFTLWTERHHYEDYLAWRTARGFTDTFEAMLTEPLVINYYDEVFYSPRNSHVPVNAGRRGGGGPVLAVRYRACALFCDEDASSPACSGRLRVLPAGASGQAQAGS
jgi:quinol monooxygenase YgiN